MENDNQKILNTCHFLVTCISIVLILASALVIIGTFYHITVFTNIVPSWVNMKMNAAICFLLSGLSLYFLNYQDRGTILNFLTPLFLLSILVICGLTVIEYLFGINIGIDEFFIKEYVPLPPGTVFAGRMAFITALSFLFATLSFFAFFKKSISTWFPQTLAWLIQLCAFTGFFNYLYGADITYAFAKYTTMAMHTVILFVLMGFGILLLRPNSGIVGIILKKNTTGYLLRRIIAIPIILPIFLIYIVMLLEKAGVVDTFGVFVVVQVMIFLLTGIMILIVSVLLDKKERQIQLEAIYKKIQYNLARLVETENDLKGFSHKVLAEICQSLDFDLGALWIIDESKAVLSCVDIWHKESELLRTFSTKSKLMTFKRNEGFPGEVLKSQKPIWKPNYSSSQIYSQSNDAKLAQLNSVIGIPIIYREKIYGVIEFFSFNIRNPEKNLLQLMEVISKSVGELVENLYLIEKEKSNLRHDKLTGLLSRPAFEEDLNKLIRENTERDIAVMVFDVDRFKLINEAFGHEYGDLLLKKLTSVFSLFSEKVKIGLSRLGADKFIFYFLQMDKMHAYTFAEEIQHIISEPFLLNKNKIHISASIGIALYPLDASSSSSLVQKADLAMVNSKYQGGGKITFYSRDLISSGSKILTMDLDLRDAIKNNQFRLEYDPQVDLKTGLICCAEVLVRWQHPIHGLIYPNEFIPFAESNNLIIQLNEHIMRMVFNDFDTNLCHVPVSINISSQQFRDGFHLVNFFSSLMNEFHIPSNLIEAEITENTLLDDTEHNIAVLHELKKLGVRIAIDDFGTGFSSFSYLRRMSVHKIKIDKSFIAGLPGNTDNAKIVKGMITMVHSLDQIVVAEGAETKAEVDFLKQEKCDIVQGYYYFKPMSYQSFIALLNKKE